MNYIAEDKTKTVIFFLCVLVCYEADQGLHFRSHRRVFRGEKWELSWNHASSPFFALTHHPLTINIRYLLSVSLWLAHARPFINIFILFTFSLVSFCVSKGSWLAAPFTNSFNPSIWWRICVFEHKEGCLSRIHGDWYVTISSGERLITASLYKSSL